MALWLPAGACAQSAYERYIDKYSDMAIDQMKRYGIPAKDHLAQGLAGKFGGKKPTGYQGK